MLKNLPINYGCNTAVMQGTQKVPFLTTTIFIRNNDPRNLKYFFSRLKYVVAKKGDHVRTLRYKKI